MKKRDLLFVLPIVAFVIFLIVDRFFYKFSDIVAAIFYCLCSILIVIGFITNKKIIREIKKKNKKEKVAYLLILIVDIIVLGYVDLFENGYLLVLFFLLHVLVFGFIDKYLKGKSNNEKKNSK